MTRRNIVNIDESLCNGCGLCIHSCVEGAIKLIDGKARLVNNRYCDGLGACLGKCPQGAISITQRDVEEFDANAVKENAQNSAVPITTQFIPLEHIGGCPGAMTQNSATDSVNAKRQWPIQLKLLSPNAPYFQNADLLLAADCVAFTLFDFYHSLLTKHALAIACPKLDETASYTEKLAAIITEGGLHSITIAMMQVPCCQGLERIVELAKQLAKSSIPVYRVIIGIDGAILLDERK